MVVSGDSPEVPSEAQSHHSPNRALSSPHGQMACDTSLPVAQMGSDVALELHKNKGFPQEILEGNNTCVACQGLYKAENPGAKEENQEGSFPAKGSLAVGPGTGW